MKRITVFPVFVERYWKTDLRPVPQPTSPAGGGQRRLLDSGIRIAEISSYTTHYEHTKVYLQAENGEQEMFSVPNFHLDAIEGHDVIVINLIDDNQKNELVAFINITIGKVQCLECSLDADIIDPDTMDAYAFLTVIATTAVWVFTSWKWALSTFLITFVLGYIASATPRRLAENRNLIRQRVRSREKTKEDIINILQQRHHISQQHYHLVTEAVRLTNDRTPTKDS